MEEYLTLGDEHTIQYTNDVYCTHEIYIIVLTNVNPINLIQLKINKWRGCKKIERRVLITIQKWEFYTYKISKFTQGILIKIIS